MLMVMKDEEGKEENRIKFDDLSQFEFAVDNKPQNIDEVCENLKNTVGLP